MCGGGGGSGQLIGLLLYRENGRKGNIICYKSHQEKIYNWENTGISIFYPGCEFPNLRNKVFYNLCRKMFFFLSEVGCLNDSFKHERYKSAGGGACMIGQGGLKHYLSGKAGLPHLDSAW